MPRLIIIILILCLSLADKTKGQNHEVDKSSTDSLLKVKSDSVVTAIAILLKDTAYVNSIARKLFSDSGEFVSSKYKISYPANTNVWVNDYEHLFTKDQMIELDSIITNFEKTTTNEIAIVTIDKSFVLPENFDSLILAIHNSWGVGKKDKNNGIVIGISASLKKIRISNGYGIENKLSNSQTKKIIDETIIPEYKKGELFAGTKKGLLEIIKALQ